MKRFYVYILLCSDNSYYTGITNNLERRFNEHQSGIHPGSYTYSRRPLKLMFVRDFPRPLLAIAFEKQVKRWSRAKKEALIRGDISELKRLAECRNETHVKYWKKDEQAGHSSALLGMTGED